MTQNKPKSIEIDRAFAVARNHFNSGDIASAELLLKQIIAQDAAYAGAYYYLGRLANATGHPAHAVPLFEEAVRLEPANVEYVRGLAKHFETCDEIPRAMAALQSGITLNPRSRELQKLLDRMRTGSPAADDSGARLAEVRRLAGQDRYQELATLTEAILLDDEGNVEARYYYGMSLLYTGGIDEAEQQISLVLQRQPDNDEAWGQLGVALMHRRKPGESYAAHQRALQIKPNEPTHHINAATAYLEFGDLDKARAHGEKALLLMGDSVAAMAVLGRIAGKRGEYDKARLLLSKALQLVPNFKPALTSLVDVSLAEGKLKETEWECRRLIAMDRNLVEAYNTLTDALTAQEKHEEAREIAEAGLRKWPEHVPLLNRLGISYNNLKRYTDAIAKYKEVLVKAPEYYPSQLNLGGMHSITGQHSLAMEYYAEALESEEVQPDHVSSWIFCHLYDPTMSAKEILEISKQWAREFHGDVSPCTTWNTSTSPDAPLRLGIISGDFRNHPVGFFLESVLTNLSALGVEIYLYSTVLTEDSATERFIELADQWYSGYKDSPDTLAGKIRDDAVNILVDVAGHTAHNRLSVFARKPAPVQITWLGYLSTSGLDTMDYIIGDPWVTPKEEADHFVEEPLVLPNTYQCLSEPPDSPDVAELPALTNNYITFGSFNNFAKLNDPVIDLWAEVLKSVDGSKLLLKNQVLTDPEFQEVLRKKFIKRGVDRDRLVFEASLSREHILESYGRLDIGLDPFPYTGCTTSFESLWMGIPIITRTGDRFLSHAGESIMSNLSLPDWIARDAEDYVRIAIEKASDIKALADTRDNLRDRVIASPLMDADIFSRQLHEALGSVWARWLAENPEDAHAVKNQ